MKATLKGDAVVVKQLRELSDAVQGRIIRRALNAAADPVKARAIEGARRVEDSGLLGDSIRLHMETVKKEGRFRAHIRPAGRLVVVEQTGPDGVKRQKRTRASRYAHAVEFGTKHVTPRPFMRPAVESTKAQTEAAFAASIADGVAKQIKKTTKR